MRNKEFKSPPFKLVYAGVLVVVDPTYTIEVANCSHVFREFLGFRPLEIVYDGDYITLRL